jgi:hypothetical protein
VILPRTLFGSAYADMRLVPYMIAVRCSRSASAAAPDRTGSKCSRCSACVLRDPAGGNTISLAIAANDQRRSWKRSTIVPRGRARRVSLVGRDAEIWAVPRNSHLGAMVMVRREGFSNDQWQIEGVNLLDLKYDAPGISPPIRRRWSARTWCRDPLDRTTTALAALPRDDFDYVWLIDVPPTTRNWSKGHEAGLARARLASSIVRSMTALSIVVPCFNEEACLPRCTSG